jgi:hypothetical protein
MFFGLFSAPGAYRVAVEKLRRPITGDTDFVDQSSDGYWSSLAAGMIRRSRCEKRSPRRRQIG